MKFFQFLDMPVVQGSCFISVEESPQCMACFADLSIDFFVQKTIPDDYATQVFEDIDIFKLGVIYGHSWCRVVGVWC